jgi:DNA repair exonuclease SbcCD nuclease subunit
MRRLLIGDWHWTTGQPKARLDDYMDAQKRVLEWLITLCKKEKIDEINQAGDFFDYWKQPHELLTYLIHKLRELPPIVCCCGQHDLPRHSIELYEKSAISILQASGLVSHEPYCFHWDDKIKDIDSDIAIIHIPIYHNDNPYKSENITPAIQLLKSTKYKLIITGDNHQQFMLKDGDRYLVNPGSVHRTTASQLSHTPAVYIYDGDTVERVEIPQNGVELTREHIEDARDKDERISMFVDRLETGYEKGLDFMGNLSTFFQNNRVRTKVKDIVYECCDTDCNA